MPIYVDAEGHVAGRLSSWVAKKALEGKDVVVVNSEKAIIIGSKRDIIMDFSAKYARGEMYRGPFYPRMPDQILRRIIRGMLPYNKARGRIAFRRVKTYIGVPPGISLKDCIKLEEAMVHGARKCLTLGEISIRLGASWGEKYLPPAETRIPGSEKPKVKEKLKPEKKETEKKERSSHKDEGAGEHRKKEHDKEKKKEKSDEVKG